VTIRNGNGFDVADPRIRCDFIAPSGATIGTAEQTVYQPIKAGGDLVVRDFNFGTVNPQASQASCLIAHYRR
jgi:hypothetical protein